MSTSQIVLILCIPNFLYTLMDLFSMSQVVTGHTRKRTSGRCSLIDLVFTSNPSTLHTCSVIPPLANSDHLGVLSILQLLVFLQSPQNQALPSEKLEVSHADYSKARQLISDTIWEADMSDDIDQSWFHWQHNFLLIIGGMYSEKGSTTKTSQSAMVKQGNYTIHEKKKQFVQKGEEFLR